MFKYSKMCLIYLFLSLIAVVVGAATDSYKDQYCTDPRTMQKHAAYSEWPDSYSCTRHRCQPGGRNLAIYTVGCKRVEAPESAIECEEVVEDTNMQFPYCCTRLRCLVVVRGEVWTRVLGQPWETLPAAPWSHMYKMKKPPPGENAFSNKNVDVKGPVYELQAENDNDHEKTLRTSKKSSTTTECNEPVARAAPSPDIVIALATPNDEKKNKKDNARHKKSKTSSERNDDNDEADKEHFDIEIDDGPGNEKATWTEIPQNQWNEHDPAMDVESPRAPVEKTEKTSGLQALVDAIGNRMRDIETVVHKMSEKVQKPDEFGSGERRSDNEAPRKHQKLDDKFHDKEELEKPKKPSPDDEHYTSSRFSVKNRGSKYLHNNDVTSEQPVFVDDVNPNGYFSDASNSVMRRSMPKEPAISTYMAPVENRRRTHDVSDEGNKKHKKHTHKRKRKGKGRKKHHNKEDKKKHVNVLASAELDKNVVSLEDSGTNF